MIRRRGGLAPAEKHLYEIKNGRPMVAPTKNHYYQVGAIIDRPFFITNFNFTYVQSYPRRS